MINIHKKEDCNGCCACVDICPTKAISLVTDSEGFWYPDINISLCTACERCNKTCPELHVEELKKNDFEQPVCYAAIHKNLETRFDSTSGGLFSALAEEMYKDGGYVGGAIYNEDFSVRHFISNNKKDLRTLRGSKYLQSDVSGFYTEIKTLLTNGEKVLACGTPCQMAALRRFLVKDYNNLIIVDFVCRGINSPKVFLKYLKSIEKLNDSKVVNVQSKNKELGWRNLTFKATFENNKSIFETKETNLFTRGYLATNAYCRPSCYTCQFKGFPRIADITLADFWGIENFEKSLDNDLGTSMVLLNSRKGLAYFEQIKEKTVCREVKFENVLPHNPALVSPLGKPKIDREQFFKDLDTGSFDDVASKYFPFPEASIKEKIKQLLRTVLAVKETTRLHPTSLYQFLKYNFLRKNVTTNWKTRGFLIPTPYSVLEIDKNTKVTYNGTFRFGVKRIKKSKLESRLLIDPGGTLEVNGDFVFGYGADVEIFRGATLVLNENGGTNINTTIICGEKIVIGKNVRIGRNVTIRDNNGNHYLSRQGYKTSRPIIIGDHVWLCEGSTIMPGVKIGDGAIVGANSLVINNVPANSIVIGNPAKVIDVDVLWKS